MNEQHGMADILVKLRNGQISRRQALQMMGAAGIAVVAGSAMASRALAQDASTPMAMPMATPMVGPQADGSNLWQVNVGGMDMKAGIDVHAFLPSFLTVNAGDSIWFNFAPMGVPAFHTVTFLSGAPVPALFVPDIVDGTPVPSPQGPPRLIINPAFAFPDGRTEYDGTGMLNSGLDVLRTPDQPPYVVKFTTAGKFDYQCAIHGLVMKGTITVQDAGSSLPVDVAGAALAGQQELSKLVADGNAAATAATAAAAAATPAASGPTSWSVSAGAGGMSPARVMRFIPAELTIKAGDTVTWTDMTIGEPHTVTFLGGTQPPEDTSVEPQANGNPKLVQSYDTLLPAGSDSFDGTGYHNSGFLGLPPDIVQMLGLKGDSYSLTFTTPGEYAYYCILHSGGPDDQAGMTGKVTVQ
jgi:plastocyanin